MYGMFFTSFAIGSYLCLVFIQKKTLKLFLKNLGFFQPCNAADLKSGSVLVLNANYDLKAFSSGNLLSVECGS